MSWPIKSGKIAISLLINQCDCQGTPSIIRFSLIWGKELPSLPQFSLFKFLKDVELSPNIKWEYKSMIWSQTTELSNFPFNLYPSFWILVLRKFSLLTAHQNSYFMNERNGIRWILAFKLENNKKTIFIYFI